MVLDIKRKECALVHSAELTGKVTPSDLPYSAKVLNDFKKEKDMPDCVPHKTENLAYLKQ